MEYELIRSRRKTLSLQITSDERVVIKAPIMTSQRRIDEFLAMHAKWIEKNLSKRHLINEKMPVYSDEDVEKMRNFAKEVIPQRVEKFSSIMNLKPTGIKITSAKKRYGSCSAKNSLCFSLYLMAESDEFIDYVVIHELSHIKYHNHSARFWNLVKTYCPVIPKSRIEQL